MADNERLHGGVGEPVIIDITTRKPIQPDQTPRSFDAPPDSLILEADEFHMTADEVVQSLRTGRLLTRIIEAIESADEPGIPGVVPISRKFSRPGGPDGNDAA